MSTVEKPRSTEDEPAGERPKPDGPVAAAMLASGVGVLALGLVTVLAMANRTIQGWLELKDSVGPLSGKTAAAVVAWVLAWALLHRRYRNAEVDLRRALIVTLVLVGLGVLGTFPPFFQSFGPDH